MQYFFLDAKNSSLTTDVSHQVSRQTNFLTSYFSSINWNQIISKMVTLLLSIILLSLFFILINWIGKRIIYRSFKTTRKNEHLTVNRINTIYTLSLNIFHYSVLFFYFYAILSVLGIPVGTLIAGAGIMSVALGLGAQGFVTDVVTGFFILLEQQFDVGDEVKIGQIEGTIHAIGLRTTQVIGYDGTLHFVPNRNITIVSNLSRNDMRALIDIYFDPTEDIQAMSLIIKQVNDKLTSHFPDITKKPTLLGTVDNGKGNLSLRVVIYTKNGAQYEIQRTFLAAYLEELRKAGFKINNSPLNLTNV
ncbi:potassium efflux system KefA protein [Liquorilactobacillus sucicola DSM 21376 = JCM 15457]|uniref:Small-conductance mechanosensitive channel n=1 Tax=Liquorilactobacillus sucicola DSM 21376 = JCM 15457 TaxID=1423806 RepID=A0A023CZU6_9LACO|nr:mechanosensitive ion channel family protein [Liquorilactobacillus sucicola]KRN06431.1 small-conductance mechanosensitive channel [Liquorilactobacillus sucicola DSM 21376 = JCM 15457]GAJ27438.1 potassium efflux system KefA protein [Liquorilactobacillus sucicola DSM 21376 = JCM 15457]